MKRIFVCLIVLMCTVMLCSAASPEVKIPAKGDHPRLVFDKEEFKQLKGMVGGEDVVGKLHDHLMNVADDLAVTNDLWTYQIFIVSKDKT